MKQAVLNRFALDRALSIFATICDLKKIIEIERCGNRALRYNRVLPCGELAEWLKAAVC